MTAGLSSTAANSDAPLMLSVSGARGIVGQSMTEDTARRFAAAWGSIVKETSGLAQPVMCVGRDGRPSGATLGRAAMDGLASVGCRVIDLGVVTTPSVAVMIAHHKSAGGMAITASHNPIQWNGLKCLNADGNAPPPETANQVIARFKGGSIDTLPDAQRPTPTSDDSTHRRHVDLVLKQVDAASIRAARFKVALDSVNASGCVAGRMLLEELGCEVVHLNGEPTGVFPHTPEPTEENLRDLARETKSHGAAAGFAQDPDADRMAIIDETGTYIGEEYTLVLAAKRVLARWAGSRQSEASRPSGLKPQASHLFLAANLSTSRMIDDVAAAHTAATGVPVEVLRTAVGEANVVAAMKSAGAILGGEGNGGVILPGVCWVRDSLSAMALTLSLMAAEKKPLSEIIRGLPRYRMVKRKFDLQSAGGMAAVKPALERFAKRFADQKVSTIDGVRVDFADGWVHLRASNTEPIVRLIAEAKTDDRVRETIDQAAQAAGLT